MNKERRKELRGIVNRLLALKCIGNENIKAELDEIKSDLESILYEEESYMDNIPENLQGGRRYQSAEEACDNLQDAICELEENCPNINEAINYINEAAV